MTKIPLVIFGAGDFADIAYEYFTRDSNFEVVAFTVDREYLIDESKFNLPILPFEDIGNHLEPKNHHFFAAVTYGKLNDLRKEVGIKAQYLGFRLASYISSRSFVWPNVSVGEHCFIFEDNTVQPFVSIGNNVVLWSGNHIGHHSQIKENVFISSHVVISGNCTIGRNCFIGVNATVVNNIDIGDRSWIGPGTLVTRNVESASLVTAAQSTIRPLNEELLFKKLNQIASHVKNSEN